MNFIKLVGSGNDFVFVDNRGGKITGRAPLARKICDRKFGVGADGLVLIEQSRKANVRMRIFNPDGSEAEMCGNALRCTGRFVHDQGLTSETRILVETKAGVYDVEILSSTIKARMRILGEPRLNLTVPLADGSLTAHFLDTGVPHAVIVTDDIASVDVQKTGAAVRYHGLFLPRGTNVDWIEPTGKNSLALRTYERGVEGETLSCGTGTVAGAVVAFLLGKVASPVTVIAASGERLVVSFSHDLKEIHLEGKTSCPFQGVWGGVPRA